MPAAPDEEKALPDGKGEEEIVVGEALPSDTKEEAKSKSSSNLKYLFLGAILVIVIVVAIAVPLVVRDDDDDDGDTKSTSLTDSSSDGGDGSDGGGGMSGAPNVTKFSVFNPDLPDFGTDVLSGYASDEEFAQGVTLGLQSFLDRVVGRNLGEPGYGNMALGGGMRGSIAFAPTAPDMAEDAAADAGAGNKGVDETVDDYGTNNQEGGVEESDKVMSNGSHLFAAYGNRVIVWNPATGDQVATIKLPAVETSDKEDGSGGVDVDGGGARPPADEPAKEDTSNRRRDSIWWGYYGPSVDSMLLMGDKLVVLASGYGSEYYYSPDHVIDHYLATRVLVYDISGLPTSGTAQEQVYKPLATKDLSGYYVSARAIAGNVHLVTTTGLQYWTRVIQPFEKNWDDELRRMSNEEYIDTVVKTANEKVIPDFVTTLMDDVRVDGKLPRFAKINTYDDGSGDNLSHLSYPDGYMDSIAFVYSFDISTLTSASESELTGVTAAGAFVPASNPIVYASLDTMIVATSGMGYHEERDEMLTKTYLMSFLLSGASAQPYTIGSVFGEIINQYSMDVVEGVLRIATTVRRAWFWGIPEPGVVAVDSDESGTSTNDGDTATVSTEEDRTDAEEEEEEEEEEESTTENYVITINIAGKDHDGNATTPAVMEQYDALKIGKPNESITAVRFFDRYAYAVTFERTDPFYKLDLLDKENIKELAAVEITGFSQYLHPFDDSEEMILAIGQQADSEGRVLGLQISLFDMRNINSPNQKPKEPIRHEIEVNPDQWSSSEALWDPKAVRFNQEHGLLIIPVYWYKSYPDKGYFDGFMLFTVTETSITENTDCSIDFASTEITSAFEFDGYSCSWLPPRAMIFSGAMVVMKDQWIARKDLTSETCGKEEWVKRVLVDAEESCW